MESYNPFRDCTIGSKRSFHEEKHRNADFATKHKDVQQKMAQYSGNNTLTDRIRPSVSQNVATQAYLPGFGVI